MKNKKGALFHWIIFGVLGALGFFFVLLVDIDVKRSTGEWQLNFLEYYVEAEKDLLETDQEIKYIGWQAILELAEEGGFIEESNCGVLEGHNLWSNATDWCWPKGEVDVLTKINEKLGESLPGRPYSDVRLEGKELIGKGEKMSIDPKLLSSVSLVDISYASYVKYTYDTSFRINLGFDVVEEYKGIILEAKELVNDCTESEELQACIEEEKGYWKFKDCKEEYVEVERKVFFCVESENKVYDSGLSLVPVRYKFALDFTPPESE